MTKAVRLDIQDLSILSVLLLLTNLTDNRELSEAIVTGHIEIVAATPAATLPAPAPAPVSVSAAAVPIVAPGGPRAPGAPAVPAEKVAPAGPVGPVLIPPPEPGKRREFTADQRRILLDTVDEIGVMATAKQFKISKSLLYRMGREREAAQRLASIPTSPRRPPSPETSDESGSEGAPFLGDRKNDPSDPFACSCGRRFRTHGYYRSHLFGIHTSQQKHHRLVEQPPSGMVGSKIATRPPGMSDADWADKKRRDAFQEVS